MKPHEAASEAFEAYAGLAQGCPPDRISSLQVRLSRWGAAQLPQTTTQDMALGAMEELGELAFALLKHKQGIRGMQDREVFRAAAGDAIADTCIFLTQLCTLLRLDFGVLYQETAERVLARDWKANPINADAVA